MLPLPQELPERTVPRSQRESCPFPPRPAPHSGTAALECEAGRTRARRRGRRVGGTGDSGGGGVGGFLARVIPPPRGPALPSRTSPAPPLLARCRPSATPFPRAAAATSALCSASRRAPAPAPAADRHSSGRLPSLPRSCTHGPSRPCPIVPSQGSPQWREGAEGGRDGGGVTASTVAGGPAFSPAPPRLGCQQGAQGRGSEDGGGPGRRDRTARGGGVCVEGGRYL